jgi:hypothetical protein
MQRQDIRDLIALLIALSEFSLKTRLDMQADQEETKEARQVGDEEMVSTF